MRKALIDYLNKDNKLNVNEINLYTRIIETQNISDGYHTFDELYEHRMKLFALICKQNKDFAWKSKLHADGTMFEDYFIVGITTLEGDFTYHYHIDNWDLFDVKEWETAKEWDGHTAEDIDRLFSLL